MRTPEQWVAEFDQGWRARRGPDAFVAHFRGLAALARAPRSWRRFARLRAPRRARSSKARWAR